MNFFSYIFWQCFQWRLLDVHKVIPQCSHAHSIMLLMLHFQESHPWQSGYVLVWSYWRSILVPGCCLNVAKMVIACFTAEPHTWTRSGEILILILDISRASFLSYQVLAPDVGFGQNGSQMWAWMNVEHSHEWKKGWRRISGNAQVLYHSTLCIFHLHHAEI